MLVDFAVISQTNGTHKCYPLIRFHSAIYKMIQAGCENEIKT